MLNKKLISKVIGSLLLLEASFMVVCVLMAICYHSPDLWPFTFSTLLTAFAGYCLLRMGFGAPTTMSRRFLRFGQVL